MTKRSIVLVIDGFGIGAMPDANKCRKEDINANTIRSLLKIINWKDIPNLTKLGLKNLVEGKKDFCVANYGKSPLGYPGADSYFGHQEINGSIIGESKINPFKNYIPKIKLILEAKGYKVVLKSIGRESVMIVDDGVLIADNIETDLGQVINVNACFDIVSFEKELIIGEIIRKNVEVTRVIVLGAHNIHMKNFTDNIENKGNGYIGVNTPKSGVYNETYMCKHLGLELDVTLQLPYILGDEFNLNSYLIAKYGDLVFNPKKENSFNISNTNEIILKSLEIMNSTKNEKCFIGINIQETDLSGHSMDLQRYVKTLLKVDDFIGRILSILNDQDLFIICADHGNDPEIGHSHHTREYVPVLIFNKKIKKTKELRNINNLNDVGQTLANWIDVKISNGNNLLSDDLLY